MTVKTCVKRYDYKGLIHYAAHAHSVFSACTIPRPEMKDHAVPLVWPGKAGADAVVTCLACLVIE